jgi:LacI family transcriptional regulator
VSVIGYDGILTARYSVPRLTTIMQDSRQFAARGTQLLLGQISGKTSAVHEVIPFRLLEGESVAARK